MGNIAVQRRWHETAARLPCLPLVAFLLLILAIPLSTLARTSISGNSGITAANYIDIIRVPRYRNALWQSLALSAGVAALSTIACLAPAWLLARHRFRGERLLRSILALPMAFSGVIVGFLAVVMIGRSGVVPLLTERMTGHALGSGLAYVPAGLVLAYLYFELPRAALTLEAALRRLDPQLEAVAASLGAGRWQRFRFVLLPRLLPALGATFAITFSASLGSFGVALILAPRGVELLPLEMFMIHLTPPPDRPLAAAMAVVLALTALAVHLPVERVTRRYRDA